AALAVCLGLGLAAARVSAPIVRGDARVSPVAALARVPADLRARPVFNSYGLGGYLIFNGVRPFIDGRTDMYGDAFNARYDAAAGQERAALDAVLQDDRIAWTMLDPAAPAVRWLDAESGWRRLYADRYAVIHVRAPGRR
ncbi:MAG: hypothetical protein JWO72_1042, partial [Caulobacteraceae bacterium]|nr:hypothetical protein [Caulobacteraceae bacterium]